MRRHMRGHVEGEDTLRRAWIVDFEIAKIARFTSLFEMTCEIPCDAEANRVRKIQWTKPPNEVDGKCIVSIDSIRRADGRLRLDTVNRAGY